MATDHAVDSEGNDVPSEPLVVTDLETRKPQHMAFTIHFADTNKNSTAVKSFQHKASNYALKHRRNQSLGVPSTEENKTAKGEVNSALAAGLSPSPAQNGVAQQPGNHSEGYFSSDQEDDIRNRNTLSERKLKNLEKGLRTTNLAQEKKIMADQTSQTKLNNSPHMSRHEFGDLRNTDAPATLRTRLDELKRQVSNPATATRDDEELSREDWLMASSNDEPADAQPASDNELDDGDGENELSDDSASEAGTYTIERDIACPDEDTARLEVDKAVSGQANSLDDSGLAADEDFKMSSYRNGTNWINDWATQVAKHTQVAQPQEQGLPPLPADKQKVVSVTTRIPSPVLGATLPPSGRPRHTPPSPTRHQPPSDPLDTESYLRATESVVTAMQARIGMAQDSDTSHDRGRSSTSNRRPVERLPSNASDGSPRPNNRTPQSECVSDAKKEGTPPPPMRYNRAFSLRRARLDSEPAAAVVVDNRKKKSESLSAASHGVKKVVEQPVLPPNIPLQRAIKAANPKPEAPKAFSRTDCGRFSVRGPKTAVAQASSAVKPGAEVKKPAASKKDPKKSGGRSNSTLSSREVEFQNWKRRKSYDPMKAAAEGKKKDAAKKATFSNSMTQSYTTAEESTSPSHQTSVLRSASFHGSFGLAPKCASSEEEVTLSAEEEEGEDEEEGGEESPETTEYAPPLPPVAGSPTKSLLDGAIGSSRISLHSSSASNSSLRGRTKVEALDSLVMTALSGLSNKLRGRSCILLKKLRYLYEEDIEKSEQLTAIIEVLEGSATNPSSPQSKTASKELSDTLKNLKRLECFVNVLDEVLFDDEDFDDMDADK